MKSKAARDAINSVIQDKLRKGSVPGKLTACQYGNSILGDLSEIIDGPLTLEEQTYLNERKLKNMKAVLFYDNGEQYEPQPEIKVFDSKEEMIEFINKKNIGTCVIAAYEFYKEIEIEPYEKVVNYKIKNNN